MVNVDEMTIIFHFEIKYTKDIFTLTLGSVSIYYICGADRLQIKMNHQKYRPTNKMNRRFLNTI